MAKRLKSTRRITDYQTQTICHAESRSQFFAVIIIGIDIQANIRFGQNVIDLRAKLSFAADLVPASLS